MKKQLIFKCLVPVEQPGFYDIEKYKNLEDLIANLEICGCISMVSRFGTI